MALEVIFSSDTSVDFQRDTRRFILEDKTLHNHRWENVKSYIELGQCHGFIYSLNYGSYIEAINSPDYVPELWLRAMCHIISTVCGASYKGIGQFMMS